MKFTVIEGNFGRRPAAESPVSPTAVREEASRRLREAGYDAARTRSFMTGRPVPADLVYFRLQVDFTAEALARMAVIPIDFRSDLYWPIYEPGTQSGQRL